jgi:retron-type reverse transcriptase
MKDTKDCVESRQLHIEDYLYENRVELKGNTGVRSNFSMSEKEENDVNEYTGNLLERILDRDNMNKAYKRVKANKGSHGVDGMTADELLQYLKQNDEWCGTGNGRRMSSRW